MRAEHAKLSGVLALPSGRGTRGRRLASVALAALLGVACGPERPDLPRSILLVVIDTLRADAVSAYGTVEGTSPTLDALASEGLLYRRAFAPSPWTLPSHASLLSGQPLESHRVGTPGRIRLADGAVTLAERLREAGYQTAAFSENMLVSDLFNLLQGFELRRVTTARRIQVGGTPLAAMKEVEVVQELGHWLKEEVRGRHFFAFVNLFDVHSPYTIRPENPWVPEHIPRTTVNARSPEPERQICAALASDEEIAVQRGLYLGEVAAADAKLRELVALAQNAAPGGLITVVTSDHGEYLGERRLLGHQFGLGSPVLHVPLVVHGAPQAAPGVIEAPVELVDVAPSLLQWGGLVVPPDLPGRVLPVHEAALPEDGRPVIGAYTDRYVIAPEEWAGMLEFDTKDELRRRCLPSEPVFGSMASLIRYPWKLIWFERYAPELYDLSWDAGERSDLAAYHGDRVDRMRDELQRFAEQAGLTETPGEDGESLSEEAIQSLEALGYID